VIDDAPFLEGPVHHAGWTTGNATVGLLDRAHDNVRGHRKIREGSTDGDAHRATVRDRINDHEQVVVAVGPGASARARAEQHDPDWINEANDPSHDRRLPPVGRDSWAVQGRGEIWRDGLLDLVGALLATLVQGQQKRSIRLRPIRVERGQWPCSHGMNEAGQVVLVDHVLRADLLGRQLPCPVAS